ncbi:MAG: AAA family ATPase [Acidobacteriota bacterium]
MNEIVIPRNTLIILCGPAGSGKSTWAAKHFLPTQVVSSDECRALVVDDPANQSVSQDAFDLMYFIIEKRLLLGRLTVADATNLKREHRRALIRIAKRFHYNTAAIVFNVPIEVCLERNAARERQVPQEALMNQYALLEMTLRTIENEGFNFVHVLDGESQSSVPVRIGRYVSRRPPRQVS